VPPAAWHGQRGAGLPSHAALVRRHPAAAARYFAAAKAAKAATVTEAATRTDEAEQEGLETDEAACPLACPARLTPSQLRRLPPLQLQVLS
jgi:hypothetical protein